MTSSRLERIEKAVTLLRPGIPDPGGVWADVGCGDGVFTAALQRLIRPGGEIYAVDKNQRALDTLTRYSVESLSGAILHPVRADFTRGLALPPLDGLVMANSLHFVRNKAPVLAQLIDLLKPGGRLIVVEYNTNQGNRYVPHPLDEFEFLTLARRAGLIGPSSDLAAIDSTGLETRHVSRYYTRRCERHRATTRAVTPSSRPSATSTPTCSWPWWWIAGPGRTTWSSIGSSARPIAATASTCCWATADTTPNIIITSCTSDWGCWG